MEDSLHRLVDVNVVQTDLEENCQSCGCRSKSLYITECGHLFCNSCMYMTCFPEVGVYDSTARCKVCDAPISRLRPNAAHHNTRPPAPLSERQFLSSKTKKNSKSRKDVNPGVGTLLTFAGRGREFMPSRPAPLPPKLRPGPSSTGKMPPVTGWGATSHRDHADNIYAGTSQVAHRSIYTSQRASAVIANIHQLQPPTAETKPTSIFSKDEPTKNNHSRTSYIQSSMDTEITCYICHQGHDQSFYRPACGHLMCYTCFLNPLQTLRSCSCKLCRKAISEASMIPYAQIEYEAEQAFGPSHVAGRVMHPTNGIYERCIPRITTNSQAPMTAEASIRTRRGPPSSWPSPSLLESELKDINGIEAPANKRSNASCDLAKENKAKRFKEEKAPYSRDEVCSLVQNQDRNYTSESTNTLIYAPTRNPRAFRDEWTNRCSGHAEKPIPAAVHQTTVTSTHSELENSQAKLKKANEYTRLLANSKINARNPPDLNNDQTKQTEAEKLAELLAKIKLTARNLQESTNGQLVQRKPLPAETDDLQKAVEKDETLKAVRKEAHQELPVKDLAKESVKESFEKPRDKFVWVPKEMFSKLSIEQPVKEPVGEALPGPIKQLINDSQPATQQLSSNETNTLSAADKKVSAESFATACSDADSFISFKYILATSQEKKVRDNTESTPKTQFTAEAKASDVDSMLREAELTISGAKGPQLFRKSDLSIVDLGAENAIPAGGKDKSKPPHNPDAEAANGGIEELSGSLELLNVDDAFYSDDEFKEIVDGWMLI